MKPEPEADPRIVRTRAAATVDPPPRSGTESPLRLRDTLIERIIRGAQEKGAFDDLRFQGERLPLEDDSAAGEMASAFHILRNAGAAPRWIEADKEVRRLLADRERLLDRASRAGSLSRPRYRRQLRELVEAVNRAVVVLNHEAPTERQHRRPLDLGAEMAALERRWPW